VSSGVAPRAGRRLFLVAAALAAAAAQPAAADHLQSTSARAMLDVQRQNVKLIADTLHQARRQYAAGEITATDVAQVEAQLALARSSLAAAEAQYAAARADYLAAIGVESGAISGASHRKQLLRHKTSSSLQKH
jgi:outer membrane protein TolC